VSAFEPAIAVVLRHECGPTIAEVGGGFVHDPRDKGGATVYGLSEVIRKREGLLPEDLGVADFSDAELRKVPRAAAEAVYLRVYWERYRYERIDDQLCATKVFDAAVNMIPWVAHRIAQQACNNLGARIDVDGFLGVQSFGAINALEPQEFLRAMRDGMAAHYKAIVERDPSQACWLSNWLWRAAWPNR
jgi:lysozyme family protein